MFTRFVLLIVLHVAITTVRSYSPIFQRKNIVAARQNYFSIVVYLVTIAQLTPPDASILLLANGTLVESLENPFSTTFLRVRIF